MIILLIQWRKIGNVAPTRAFVTSKRTNIDKFTVRRSLKQPKHFPDWRATDRINQWVRPLYTTHHYSAYIFHRPTVPCVLGSRPFYVCNAHLTFDDDARASVCVSWIPFGRNNYRIGRSSLSTAFMHIYI